MKSITAKEIFKHHPEVKKVFGEVNSGRIATSLTVAQHGNEKSIQEHVKNRGQPNNQ